MINTNGFNSSTYANPHNSMSWAGSSSPDPLIKIGRDNAWQGRIFNGVINEVAVFSKALTAGQLQGLTGLVFVNQDPTTADFKATVSGGAGNQILNFNWAPDHATWQLYTIAAAVAAFATE